MISFAKDMPRLEVFVEDPTVIQHTRHDLHTVLLRSLKPKPHRSQGSNGSRINIAQSMRQPKFS